MANLLGPYTQKIVHKSDPKRNPGRIPNFPFCSVEAVCTKFHNWGKVFRTTLVNKRTTRRSHTASARVAWFPLWTRAQTQCEPGLTTLDNRLAYMSHLQIPVSIAILLCNHEGAKTHGKYPVRCTSASKEMSFFGKMSKNMHFIENTAILQATGF